MKEFNKICEKIVDLAHEAANLITSDLDVEQYLTELGYDMDLDLECLVLGYIQENYLKFQ